MYKDLVSDKPIPDPTDASRKLRVAVVTETYPPEVNGVARTLARMVEGLHSRGHDVQLVRPQQPEPAIEPRPRFEQLMVRSMPIPFYPQLRMGLASKGSLQRLWRLRRPNIVHVATEGPLGWTALSAAQGLGLPVSSDFRTNFHAYTQHYGMAWLHRPMAAYLRRFHNRAACTMVPTERLRKELAASGFERLEVVARGVDTELFDPSARSVELRASWGVQPTDLVMTCVGRLAQEKNLGLLLQAYRAVCQVRPGTRLLLVGDGPMRAELQAACPEALLVGQRSGQDLAAHYASADLFVFPSQTETFGNVTMEALAAGLPVLAFDHAAAGQIIETGRNGVICPVDAPEQFIDAACQLACDNALRQSMAPAARATALAHGWDPVIDRFEAILTQLAPARA
jgi:glycosyltransferase involved in cell wall biosynthesis